ncbi:GNAT family N-acetyltransferase [Paenibacillus sp. GYB003]|uniref:GNAT family N-acetyltransferase n=1 Tax=Paenibacillus sp. GYB003 TaxID=2994392 RepID=UPI002F96E443
MANVRPCTLNDIPQVVRLSNRWAEEGITKGYENVKWTEEKLAAKLSDYFFVAETEDGIVAYTFGAVKTSGGSSVIRPGERYLDIYEVYIAEGHRGGGLGSRLVRALLDQAEAEGIVRATVGSSNKNWRQVAGFYEQLGFDMWYIQMVKG